MTMRKQNETVPKSVWMQDIEKKKHLVNDSDAKLNQWWEKSNSPLKI